MCSKCQIFVSKRTFGKHKCVNQALDSSFAIDAATLFNPSVTNETFLSECVSKIVDDEIGILIKETPLLIYLGERLFVKTSDAKRTQKKRRINSYLRKMGSIYNHFKKNVYANIQFPEMFSTKLIDNMPVAIKHCISGGKSQGPMYANAVRYTCSRLSMKYFNDVDHSLSEMYDKYKRSFNDMYSENFRNETEETLRDKQKKSMNGEELPDSSDIGKIVKFCESIINKEQLTVQSFGTNYVWIRRALCTLLTMDNSRRGELQQFIYSSFLYLDCLKLL